MRKPYPKKEELLEIIKNDEALIKRALELIDEDERWCKEHGLGKIQNRVIDFQRAMVMGGSIDYGATMRDEKRTPIIRVVDREGFNAISPIPLTKEQKKITRDFIRHFGKIISFGCHDWLKLTKQALDKQEKLQKARIKLELITN